MESIDTLLIPEWILPMDGNRQALTQTAVAIHQGKIIAIDSSDALQKRYAAKETLRLPGQALLPGFINCHTHAAMTLLRGLADDLPLMNWLQEHIWPAEGQHVSAQFAADGTEIAIAEMLRSGTTCFNDMYFFPEATAETANHFGMRAVVGMILIDFPTAYAQNADEYFEKGLALHDRFKDHPLISTTFAPHAPYTVSDAPLTRVMTLANELDVRVHMHIHETQGEVEQAVEQSGIRPLERLQKLGLINASMLAVHMTALSDDEIEHCGRVNANVVHCPESNLKLASGQCPVQALLNAGVNVALGTDGTASNNDLDMLGELRSAALLGKITANDASAVSAWTALEMATINGAKALGLDDLIGSIIPGKAADLISIDLSIMECQPVYDAASSIVYSATREQIKHTWVNGKHLLNNRQLMHMSEKVIQEKYADWKQRIQP